LRASGAADQRGLVVSSAGTDPLLEVSELAVRYRLGTRLFGAHSFRAVAGVSFTLQRGESLGLVGESGSGKSSIARALLRLIPATGSVRYRGLDLLQVRAGALRALRERLQIIFQDPLGSLDPRMSVAELVAEPLREFRPALARAGRRERVTAMLGKVGLGSELLPRFPHQLSGGQAQRVGIARALMLGPELLICDEPVAALDMSIKSQVANLLRDMREEFGLTLLFIAHDLATVRYLCERVLVLYRGRVMEIAGREALFSAPQHPYTLLAANPSPDPRRRHHPATLPGEAPATLEAPSGCVFRHRCPLAVARCASEVPLLRVVGASLVACHRAGE
jgi:oligopeptide transport system ATP-binding protein